MIRDKNNVRRAMSAAAGLGVRGDDSVVHASSDEMVIPSEVVDAHPQVMGALIKAFQASGMDWRKYIVGSPKAQKNPNTGAEMFPPGYGAGDAIGDRGRDFGENRDGGDANTSPGMGGINNPEIGRGGVHGSPETYGEGFGRDDFAGSGGPDFNPDTMMKMTVLGPLGPLGYGLGQLGRHLATPNPDGTYGYTPDIGMAEQNIERSRERGDPLAKQAALEDPTPLDPGMPDYLEFPTDMTPQQQRVYIANMGLNSDDSRYTTDETQDYYKYLISTELQNAGDLSPLSPVEEQYLREVLGLAWTDYDDLMRQLIV